MARFHVYALKSEDIFVIDLQAELLDDLKTRIVAPLYPATDFSWSFSQLNPRFLINDESYVMATQRMTAVPLSEIGDVIADLSAKRDEIVIATDFLFQGF